MPATALVAVGCGFIREPRLYRLLVDLQGRAEKFQNFVLVVAHRDSPFRIMAGASLEVKSIVMFHQCPPSSGLLYFWRDECLDAHYLQTISGGGGRKLSGAVDAAKQVATAR